MLLLFTYVFIALFFSFLCSIYEAVLLSVTSTHVALLIKEQNPSGILLKSLKADPSKPLAAILTLNTIAHTAGAAGAGAQAAVIFGNAYVGLASAILTLLILVFSEIIPKTLGAYYWRQLAPATAHSLRFLIVGLYPFVKLSELITKLLRREAGHDGLTRKEFSVMAEVSAEEGHLASQESEILKNLMRFRDTRVEDVMTPRTVVFSLSEKSSVGFYFHQHDRIRFSRIPVYGGDREDITGFVLRSDLLLSQARGNAASSLATYRRDIEVVHGAARLTQVVGDLLTKREHIALVVDEYASMEGIVTLEDVVETLLGMEIVDEGDAAVDMRILARNMWRKRAESMGLSPKEDE